MLTTKQCRRCKEVKDLSCFGRSSRVYSSGIRKPFTYSYCKPCRVVLNRADARKHPERVRKHSRQSKLRLNYGITSTQHAAQLEAQGGRCCICKDDLRGKSPQTVHVDHCHKTGVLRGILCGPCNTGLGNFREDPARMLAAMEYLRRGGDWVS